MSTQIRDRRNVFGLLGLILLLSSLSTAFARSGATNTLTFSESLAEKVVCVAGPSCGLVVGDNFTVAGTVLLTGVNINNFDRTTIFDLTLGTLHLNNALGEDPKYATGKTSTTFTDSYVDGKGKTVVYRTVKLKWTAAQLTVSVKGKTKDIRTSGWGSILADAYADYTSGWLTNTITGSISLGDANATFGSVTCGGTVVTKQTRAKDGNTYWPSTVKITGNGLGGPPPHPPIPPAHVTPGTDTVVTNVAVNNQGGSVTFSSGPLSGVTVQIPAGAVSSNLHITVSANSASVTPNSGTFSGHVLDLQSSGTKIFDEPVQITIPFTGDSTTVPVPYYIDTNGLLHACQIISFNRGAGTLTFETFHASLFTWILAQLSVVEANTLYFASLDGFQVGNATYSTPYNRDGNCFGMCAFEQWYFTEKNGGLYPKYMQDLPVPGYAPIKGQDCIATRAMNSVIRIQQHYDEWPDATSPLTASERVAVIANIIANTAAPTMLWIRDEGHIVLAYDVFINGVTNDIVINDPNYPGQSLDIYYVTGSTNLWYSTPSGHVYKNILVQGTGSWQLEPFGFIYNDAEAGFNGSGAAQVGVNDPPYADLDHVTERNITLSGVVTNGQVEVEQLEVINGRTSYKGGVDVHGNYSIPISMHADTNELKFVTWGWNDTVGHLQPVLNTQLKPFRLILDSTQAVILVTLTWSTDETDIDLYVTDPAGHTSYYGDLTTPDGGVLDRDDQDGYGPEHWTLSGANIVRWGQEYDVRVHYWADHDPNTEYVQPTGWTVTVMVYEGTPRMQTFSYHGVLAAANSGNSSPGSGGPDWDDVCTITPVQETSPAMAPTVTKTSSGKIRITVPVPSQEECLQLKLASPDYQR